MASTSIEHRLDSLRKLMHERGLTHYIVPSEDEHASEYLAPHDELRAYITGFDGSAGTAVISLNEARLFTDGRYYLQASKQLSSSWTLMKLGLPETPTHIQYLTSLPKELTKIGVPATLLAIPDYQSLTAQNVNIQGTEDLVGQIWDSEGGRDQRGNGEIIVLSEKFTGQSASEKLKNLRKTLEEKNHVGTVLTLLDEIAWLFNLRGRGFISFNPVFFAYALILQSTAILYLPRTQAESLSADVREHLVREGIKVEAYEDVWARLKEVRMGLLGDGKGKLVVGMRTSLAVADAVGFENLDLQRSAVTDAKSIKNDTELEGFQKCHVRDGVALVNYFSWLEEEILNGAQINEYDAATRLEEFRKEGELFQGLSFTTISSTGANAAIIHYSPPEKGSAIIDKNQIYLCDSGAQYLDGTTDVTRTLHFGTPSAEEIRAFTRVLQGHIAIDEIIFPQGTTGYILDAFARRPLWIDGCGFNHGVGHGVGHFLNVHEGPMGVGVRLAYNDTALAAGNCISNEPGYYEDGKFGVRIESIVIVRPAKTPHNFNGKGSLCFEQVTLCPIQTSLIDVSLLTGSERKWINAYHERCWGKLEGLVNARGRKWLERACAAI